MKKRKTKRPRIEIVVAFGVITLEKFEKLPERVKDGVGRIIYAHRLRLAEKQAREQETIAMAA